MIYPLLTERLSILPLSEADIDVFVKYRQHPDVARFQSWDIDYSREQAKSLVASQHGVELPASDEWLQLGIYDRVQGQLLGDLALHTLNVAGEFEIGFTLAPEYQGQGIAKEAALRLLSFLFDGAGAKKVIANTDKRNRRSIALLSSLGFIEVAERGWSEEFKNEQVEVLFFELEGLRTGGN